MGYWRVGGFCLPWIFEVATAAQAYSCKLDACERLRNDLMLLAEEVEDKLLEVRQEIHRLKGER